MKIVLMDYVSFEGIAEKFFCKCYELYFLIISAKVKATQIRRSGGLDALRSGDFGK